MKLRRIAIALSFMGALGSAIAGPADAVDSFPDHPIRAIVDFPAGGTVDVLARIVAQKLAQAWGQPVVVENRPGAGGNIGAQAVASAAPDGYTLLFTPPGPLSINQSLYRQMGFDPAKLESVVVLAAVPNAIAARPDFPASSVTELIAYAKAHPGKVSYGSQGNGSTSHLTGQMFASLTGIELVHVPFRGEGPAVSELMAGRVDLFFGNISAVLKFTEDHQVKLLGLAAKARGSMAPDVPTVIEAGVPDFLASAWFAVAAPPGTPKARLDRLNAAINEILRMPEVKDKFSLQGAETVGGTPAAMDDFVRAERARWRKVIENANVTLD